MRSKEITIHTSRIRLQKVTLSKLIAMEKEIDKAVLRLTDAEVNVIGYGCTSGSLFRGLGHDQEIVNRIERIADVPAVATAGAVINAIKTLNLSKISVVTPYTEDINLLEKTFLEKNNITIQNIIGLGIIDNIEIGKQPDQVVYNLVKKVDTPWSNGIFVSCTNFKTIKVIARLEDELMKPVISSNTATFWAMLKKLQYNYSLTNFGQLMRV